MACDCIPQLRGILEKKFGKSLVMHVCLNTKTGKTFTRTHFEYIEKKGQRELKRKSFIAHEFCPFCGKKYAP